MYNSTFKKGFFLSLFYEARAFRNIQHEVLQARKEFCYMILLKMNLDSVEFI